MSNRTMTFKEYLGGADINDSVALTYAKGQYRKYRKMSTDQLEAIAGLKQIIGKQVLFGKMPCVLEKVTLTGEPFPYQFWIEPLDKRKDGKWSTNINKLNKLAQ